MNDSSEAVPQEVEPTPGSPGYMLTLDCNDYWEVYKLWIDESGEEYTEHMGDVLTRGLAEHLIKVWME